MVDTHVPQSCILKDEPPLTLWCRLRASPHSGEMPASHSQQLVVSCPSNETHYLFTMWLDHATFQPGGHCSEDAPQGEVALPMACPPPPLGPGFYRIPLQTHI